MHKDISATYFAQQNPLCREVQKPHVPPWRIIIAPEQQAQNDMLNAGKSTVPQSKDQPEKDPDRQILKEMRVPKRSQY